MLRRKTAERTREGVGKRGTFQLVNTLKTETYSTLREDVNAMLIETTCPVYKFNMRSCVTVIVTKLHRAFFKMCHQTKYAIIGNSRL